MFRFEISKCRSVNWLLLSHQMSKKFCTKNNSLKNIELCVRSATCSLHFLLERQLVNKLKFDCPIMLVALVGCSQATCCFKLKVSLLTYTT